MNYSKDSSNTGSWEVQKHSTGGKFHQHYTSSFFADFLSQKALKNRFRFFDKAINWWPFDLYG